MKAIWLIFDSTIMQFFTWKNSKVLFLKFWHQVLNNHKFLQTVSYFIHFLLFVFILLFFIFWSVSNFFFKIQVKDTLKDFDDFRNKLQKCRKQFFWYVEVCIFWKCIQYTIHWDKTNLIKVLFGQNKRYKKCPLFFFHDLQLITFLLSICDFYMSWSTSFVSLKLCVGFSILDFVSFSLNFLFLVNKMHGLFDFKTS